jgi:hypothetical protein
MLRGWRGGNRVMRCPGYWGVTLPNCVGALVADMLGGTNTRTTRFDEVTRPLCEVAAS